MQSYDWITLDLRWAALFDQFHAFAALKDRIANVHLSGQLSNGRWTVNPKWYTNQQRIIDFDTAPNILIGQWRRELKFRFVVDIQVHPVLGERVKVRIQIERGDKSLTETRQTGTRIRTV